MFNQNYDLDEEKIKLILNNIYNTYSIISIENISFGIATYMLKISLSNPDVELILRVLDPKRENVYRKELGFMEYCKSIGYDNIPNLIFYDDSKIIIKEDYYLYEYIKGEPLTNIIPKLNSRDKRKLYFEVGKIIGNLHNFENNLCCDILFEKDKVKLKKRNPQALLWIEEDFNWILDNDFKGNFLEKYIESCRNIFIKYGSFVKEKPKNISLVHFDISIDNIILSETGKLILIDFEYSGFSNPCLELARCERRLFTWRNILKKSEMKTMKKEFFKGYESVKKLPEEYEQEKVIFKLLQIIDDIGMLPEFSKKLSENKQKILQETLINELDELILLYG